MYAVKQGYNKTMYEFHPYFTNDGSVGLYNKEFNDIYHSAGGALTEAYEKFIYPVNFENLMQKNSIKLLDICYGVGYNSKSFLNFIFENYSRKNFLKFSPSCKQDIETIHTNNNLKEKLSIFKNLHSNILNNNGTIYTNNISSAKLPNIFIKAVDTDENLAYLSPFIKTGAKITKKQKIDFDYKKIYKYLNNSSNIKYKKIDKLVNFLILEKIIKSSPDYFSNKTVFDILNNRDFSCYFDKDLRGIYNFYKIKMTDSSTKNLKQCFLHNIYYRYLSTWYKNRLKAYEIQNVDFELEIDDARKIILNDKNKYDLIFLDAFTPSKCPCLWSYEFFTELYKRIQNDGMLLTYSSSAAVRSAMLEVGFYIGEIYNKRENKFTGTIASKNKELIKYPLSEFDLGLIKSSAGIFYRDKTLTAQNDEINALRKTEVENSDRISASHYKKSYML